MKRPLFSLAALLVAVASTTLTSCWRGGISSEPPVHLVPDMDFQPKLRAQSETHFDGWVDNRGMRLPVADASGKTAVVARGTLARPGLSNRTANNAFVTQNPLTVSAEVLARGRDRFDIHCAVCHGFSGQGGGGATPAEAAAAHGLVGRRWPVKIPSFHFVEGADNRVPLMPDGEFFEVITYGKGTMPAYGPRLSVEDRWSIVHYIRALQRLSK